MTNLGGFSLGFSLGFQQVGSNFNQVLPVQSVAGFTIGNFVSVLLDNGDVWTSKLLSIDPVAVSLTIQNGTPSQSSAGNFVYDAAPNAVSASAFPGFH